MTEMLFNSIVDQVVHRSFGQLLSRERQDEIQKIGKYWDFYYGYQQQYIKQYRGEELEDYNDKDKLAFNYTKAVVDEYINGVFGHPVSAEINDPRLQAAWNDIIDPMKFFNVIQFMSKCQRIAEISDTCVVMVRYDQKQRRVYFEDIRGEFVSFLADPENPKEIGTLIIAYMFDTGDPNPNVRFSKRIEIWDKNNWFLMNFDPHSKSITHKKSGKNPYGMIPAILFQPEEDDNTFYGISGIGDIVTVNESYNNLWTALMQICVMQSFSVMVLKSEGQIDVTVSPKKFLKFENSDNSTADYITPNPRINEVEKVLLDLKAELTDFSKVPASVLHSSSESAPISGYALKIKRIPIEQLWNRRRMAYGPQFKKLVEMSLLVDAIGKNETLPPDYETLVTFTYPDTPLSPQEQLLQDEHELRYGIITPVDIFIRRHPNATRDQAKEIIQRNLEETQELTMNQFGDQSLGLGTLPTELGDENVETVTMEDVDYDTYEKTPAGANLKSDGTAVVQEKNLT